MPGLEYLQLTWECPPCLNFGKMLISISKFSKFCLPSVRYSRLVTCITYTLLCISFSLFYWCFILSSNIWSPGQAGRERWRNINGVSSVISPVQCYSLILIDTNWDTKTLLTSYLIKTSILTDWRQIKWYTLPIKLY